MFKRSFVEAGFGAASDASLLAARPYKRSRASMRAATLRGRRLNLREGGFLGIETKFLDLSYGGGISASIDGSECDPAVSSLNGVVQGDGESQRDGNRYIIKRVTVKGYLELSSGVLDEAALRGPLFTFVALVLDTQTNGAQFNAEDVFVGANPHLPFRNQQFLSRFKVLASHTLVQNIAGVSGAGDDSTTDSSYEGALFSFDELLDLKVQCTGSTGGVSDLADNSLHVVCICNDTINFVKYNSRILFQG